MSVPEDTRPTADEAWADYYVKRKALLKHALVCIGDDLGLTELADAAETERKAEYDRHNANDGHLWNVAREFVQACLMTAIARDDDETQTTVQSSGGDN